MPSNEPPQSLLQKNLSPQLSISDTISLFKDRPVVWRVHWSYKPKKEDYFVGCEFPYACKVEQPPLAQEKNKNGQLQQQGINQIIEKNEEEDLFLSFDELPCFIDYEKEEFFISTVVEILKKQEDVEDNSG